MIVKELVDHICWPLTQPVPGHEMASSSTIGRRQAGRGSVMLWPMFCSDSLNALHIFFQYANEHVYHNGTGGV